MKIKPPDRIIIELTNKCNLNCSICPRKYMKDPEGFMKISMFEKIVKDIEKYQRTKIALFFRGESLLHPEFEKLVKYIRGKINNYIFLCTNGFLLNKQKADFIIDSNIDMISFSLDTIYKNKYKAIRRGSSYDKVIKNIMYFIDQKEKKNSKIEIQISMVENKLTKSDKQKFIDFWRNKADRIRIYKEHSKNGEYGKTDKNIGGKRKVCYKPLTEIAVTWDGFISYCCYDWMTHKEFGNLKNKTLKEIWESREYGRFRKLHKELKLDVIHPCNNCNSWEMYHNKDGIIGTLLKKQEYYGNL